ncbi:MAG: nucleotidyltransferase family protein [Candidatus Wolfebacteria bacterium]|nr:nucleotidyltransferase family protein [Candidatus Wolfebacteria bacterium]
MQALILCAGRGTRLRPLTDMIPKPMVPINGKPLLEHHIEQFKKHGVKEFLINLHYLPDKITDYFGDGSNWGVKITYKYEPELLGTAGAIKNFEQEIEGKFFLIYGDIFSLLDYGKLYQSFLEKPDAIGMMVIGDTDHPLDSDLSEIDKNLQFLKIHKKPHEALPKKYKAMRAVYVFDKNILQFIPEKEHYQIDHQLLPDILSKGLQFYGYETKDYLKDIGTPERYKKCQEDFKKL